MPFDWTAATATGPSTSTLRVDPDQVLQLKAELQPIYDDVDIFMQNYGQSMVMQPLGADPVSYEAADAFNENSQAAIDAARGYLDALKGVLDARPGGQDIQPRRRHKRTALPAGHPVTSTRWLPLVAALSIVLVVAGCTQSSAGSPMPDDTVTAGSEPATTGTEPSSERPREISLDGTDPCGLIPQADWPKFHIEQAGQVRENPNFKSPQCYYPGTDAGFNITLVVTEGIEAWGRRDVEIEEVDPINGFPTITMNNNVDDRACYAAVDVAEKQYLLITATPNPNDPDQLEKCDLAYQLAESAMKTLVAP